MAEKATIVDNMTVFLFAYYPLVVILRLNLKTPSLPLFNPSIATLTILACASSPVVKLLINSSTEEESGESNNSDISPDLLTDIDEIFTEEGRILLINS